jgi:class 3 adenylate cyclase/tetratricopeptide (TPR) repeat protein
MKCPQCQFDNPQGMRFCGQCGTKLGSACPQCGAEIPPDFKFCGACGAPLAAAEATAPTAERAPLPVATAHGYTPPHLAEQVLQSRAAVEGERKQVTVLFCDIVGSTALADRLGPETMHLLLNRFFELALSEVHRYEGTVNQFLGDGLMALFGAPVAHEDHARRAALAALGLQKQVEERHADLGDPYGVEIRVRMGLNTGWVVVGGIGDHLRMDYTAVGDTTNLAARLQQLAPPGAILASEDTAHLIEGYVQLEALAPTPVKGKEEPVAVFRVHGLGPRHDEQAVPEEAALTPFVGRERELAVLAELREQAAAGEAQVVGIAGEAGAGKSRLLQEFERRSRGESAVHFAGRCLSYGSGVPYLPILHLLRGAWGIAEGDAPIAVAEKVRSGLGVGAETSGLLPYLLRLLGVDQGADALAGLSAKALQTRTFAALRQAIFGAGRGRLVVVQIEDLHWVDETSEEFLSFLVEGLAGARVLLLLTYRSGYQPRWMDKSFATQIAMRRLGAGDSRAVVEAVLRRAGRVPGELTDAVLAKAEGNPFFLEELTRSFLEHESWSDVSVPDTVQGVLMARVDRLPEEHKRLLQTASVLGREFSLALLEAIGDHPEALLLDLKRWEFLYEPLAAERPAYLFKHALTQEVVYQSLLTSRRQRLHGAAGRALEALHAGRLEDVYDALAYHYPRSGDAGRAVAYLALFAEKAARGYAHAEAAKALHEALVQAERLPEPERDRRTVELVLQLADSLLPLARIPETLDVLLEHRERLERLDDPALAGRFQFWLAHTYSYLGRQDEAIHNAEAALAAAESCGDEATMGKACYVLSRDGFWSGRFAEGIRHSLRAVELLEKSGGWWWQGQAYWVAGFNHYALGQFDRAFAAMARAHGIWEVLQDPRLDPSWSTGYFHASLGDFVKGIEACRAGLERARDPLNTAAALGFLGYAYLEQRDLPRAIEALEDSVRRLEQAGMRQLLGWFSVYLGEAHLLSGHPEEARKLALQGLAIAHEAEFGYGAGLAQRALGRIAQAGGEYGEAASRLAEALETFAALQVPFEVGRTHLDLAALALARADKETAGREAQAALRIFEQLRVSPYVERTERLAGDLGVARTPLADRS